MMTKIDRDQAQAIAALVKALRPEWDTPGVMAALAAAKTRGTPYEIAHAALYAAEETSNRTPAVIPLAGEHWIKGRQLGDGSAGAPPTARNACDVIGHQSYLAHNCGACRAEQLEASTEQRAAADATTATYAAIATAGAAKVRAALKEKP